MHSGGRAKSHKGSPGSRSIATDARKTHISKGKKYTFCGHKQIEFCQAHADLLVPNTWRKLQLFLKKISAFEKKSCESAHEKSLLFLLLFLEGGMSVREEGNIYLSLPLFFWPLFSSSECKPPAGEKRRTSFFFFPSYFLPPVFFGKRGVGGKGRRRDEYVA